MGKYTDNNQGFKANRDKAFRLYSVFIKKLPKELREEFDTLLDSHLDLLPYELEQTFIDGFRIGARIMTEVYADPITDSNLLHFDTNSSETS